MSARDYIIYVLREYPRRGWRRLKRLWAPKRPLRRWYALKNFAWDKYLKARAKGRKRRAELWLERHRQAKKRFYFLKQQKQAAADGVVEFDGVPCAAWIAEWLKKSREHGWNGVLVSGYRDPEYSEQLCYAMCGAPSCPGRCAGRASNHAGKDYPAGAVDVSDFYNFGAIQKRIGSPLINALGAQDPVHFSVSGR